MTRINLVDPNFLSDQHLVAEYREIFMVGSALQRSLKSLNWQKTKESLPEKFTLNRGHVKFFYNKGKYLHKRYISISKEMRNRGMNLDPNRRFKREQWPDYLYNDWKPNRIDIDLIKDRINQKISQKPSWYRWTKYS